MKKINADAVRSRYVSAIMSYFEDEDCGMVASNAFNFPVVEDGEEGWVKVTVTISKDGGDDGFLQRDEYAMKCSEREAKAKERADSKAKKIERDKAAREAKRKAKEEKEE